MYKINDCFRVTYTWNASTVKLLTCKGAQHGDDRAGVAAAAAYDVVVM